MIGRRAAPSTPEDAKPRGFDAYDLRLGDLMRGERATLGKSLLDVQRELKIKATYIAAIENADVAAFETPGFIAGYVRSYARYLGMNPDWAFERFCAEANFSIAHGMSQAASTQRIASARNRTAEVRDPFADPRASFVPRGESIFARIEPGALGSLAVLAVLIAGIGYGGWSVLQEVQRVQLAPVDRAPRVVAEIDPLSPSAGAQPVVPAPATPDAFGPGTAESVDAAPGPGAPVARIAKAAADAGPRPAAESLDRLYRPQALDLPVLTARDGPIAAIDPRRAAAEAGISTVTEPAGDAVQVVAEAVPGVELLAVRPSWVRVQAADGTVLFEKILDAGERYAVPAMETPPLLRAGNSGSVYFVVNGESYGPAAPGAQVVRNVVLSPEALTEAYARADATQDADLSRFITEVAEAAE